MEYTEVDGTFFSEGTKPEVIKVINSVMKDKRRIVVDYGHDNGQSWGEVHDVAGYVGRSGGSIKIPLLVYNSRSTGGGGIITRCIIQIKESKGGRILYQHPNYKPFEH